MHRIEKHIQQHWDDKLKGHRILIACSAGLDSTVLLYTLKKLGYDVIAGHVNYHLRGEESNLDQAFIEQFSNRHNIPIHVYSIELQNKLEHGGNLQAIARDIRYNWLVETAEKLKCDYIAFAHHLDDQVETFFMNISRKSGVMGLSAMPIERNQFIRPLLDFSKLDLLELASKEDIVWREDQSNKSIKYKRNAFRNEFIPYLESEIPDLKESVRILIKHFQEKQKALELVVKPLTNIILLNGRLAISEWMLLDELEKIELLRQLSVLASRTLELDQLLNSQKGKRIELTESNTFESIIREDGFFSWTKSSVVNLPTLKMEKITELPTTFSKNILYLDADKIEGELVIRQWSLGDRMKPIGVYGSKLISDIIINAKIFSSEKSKVFVLHDDNNIHWCIGLKIGRLAVATDNTKNILKITISVESPE